MRRGSVAGGRRGEGCGDPLRKSRYCPSGTSSGGVDRRGPEEVVRGEGCDGSFGGLVSVYQPIWGTDEGALEGCRGEMERQVEMGGSEKLVIGETLMLV